MQKKAIRTERAPSPLGSYSQVIKIGEFVFTAGQAAIDTKTGKVICGVHPDEAFEKIVGAIELAILDVTG